MCNKLTTFQFDSDFYNILKGNYSNAHMFVVAIYVLRMKFKFDGEKFI